MQTENRFHTRQVLTESPARKEGADRAQSVTKTGKLAAVFPCSQPYNMGLAGIKDSRSQPRCKGPEPTPHSIRLGEGAKSGTSPGPVLPANLEGAVPTEDMRHPGKIMVPRQKQEGPAPTVCKVIDLSALQTNLPPVL